ncbi:MAG: sugar phosphate isomerase/epimerase family protein [Pirellulales bacterium]
MMKSAITISLVPEARKGPFVFHANEGNADLFAYCKTASEMGFDAVEIFPGSAQEIRVSELMACLSPLNLAVAAVGTGAGWVKQGLHLCDPDRTNREKACQFISDIIDVAGECGASAIIGSMQGRSSQLETHDMALSMLSDALGKLGDRAASHGQVLLYEPLNRYETDLFNTQKQAATFLESQKLNHVRLLCDLFHMNIEEEDIAAALVSVSTHIGHVHWADSNRCAVGMGHTDPQPIVSALQTVGFKGFLSAEVFPLPTSNDAANQTMDSFRKYIQ